MFEGTLLIPIAYSDLMRLYQISQVMQRTVLQNLKGLSGEPLKLR
jgi:hypothetical protein